MTASNDIAVSVRGLNKSYTIAHQTAKHSTFAEAILDRARHPFRREERETFEALIDVSFEIRKGAVVGIIGRNGAGKSTLLKILSRITEPTSGEIDIYGRVGSLLEVGTGFHPELTGRENIYLNGAILGMSRAEIRKQFDAIVDFSGVEKFLDTPVKRYSSGMYVRLAFAVAAHLQSEVMVVDEVLAVGDLHFQRKCLGKLGEVSRQGRTVIFVSHDIRTVRNLCDQGVFLRDGEIVQQGSIEEVVAAYMSAADHTDFGLPIEKDGFVLHRFDVTQGTRSSHTLDGGKAILVTVEFELRSRMNLVRLGIYLKSTFGDTITRSFTSDWDPDLENLSEGRYHATLEIPGKFLMAGVYRFGLHASRYGIGGFISEADIQREITLLPPTSFNTAHPSETIDATVMLERGWKLELKTDVELPIVGFDSRIMNNSHELVHEN
jgi:lipopolysaccharide transport system ATP-binding protein